MSGFFEEAIDLLRLGDYDAVIEALWPPSGQPSEDDWVLYASLLAQKDKRTFEMQMRLRESAEVLPPQELFLALAHRVAEDGEAPAEIAAKLISICSDKKRLLTEVSSLTRTALSHNRHFYFALLSSALQAGETRKVWELFNQMEFGISDESREKINAYYKIYCALDGEEIDIDDILSKREAFISDEMEEMAYLIILAEAMKRLNQNDQRIYAMHEAFDLIERSDYGWYFQQEISIEVDGEWERLLIIGLPTADYILNSEDSSLPDDVRGKLLILNNIDEVENWEDVLEKATNLLDEKNLWIQSLKIHENPLAQAKHLKNWIAEVIESQKPGLMQLRPYEQIDFAQADEAASLTLDETKELNQLLIDWNNVFSSDEGLKAKQKILLSAYSAGIWLPLLLKHKLYREGLMATRLLLEIKPDSNLLFYSAYHASQLPEQENKDYAFETYQELISQKPDHHSAHNNLGVIYEGRGDLENAEKSFAQAADLSPDEALYARNLKRVRLPPELRELQKQGIELEYVADASEQNRAIALAYWQRGIEGWLHLQKDLQRHFGLKPKQLTEIAYSSAWAYSTRIRCQDCQTRYEFTSRADFEQHSRANSFVCSDCQKKRNEVE